MAYANYHKSVDGVPKLYIERQPLNNANDMAPSTLKPMLFGAAQAKHEFELTLLS
jgi:1,4-dihydroxy-2-naphthoyl-CoA synthase